jgi:hypothetical protein
MNATVQLDESHMPLHDDVRDLERFRDMIKTDGADAALDALLADTRRLLRGMRERIVGRDFENEIA